MKHSDDEPLDQGCTITGPDHIEIDAIRYKISRPYLKGLGIEIGPGSHPQTVDEEVTRICFDIRSRALLAEYVGNDAESVPVVYPMDDIPKMFPKGADFVIAHNVLEHSANPILELIRWHDYLRNGGVMVISMPHYSYCEDRDRVLPSYQHVLFDYLFDRDSCVFESREHIYSFMLGWSAVEASANMSKKDFVFDALENAKRDNNDLHWHALDEPLMQFIIGCSCIFSGIGISFECIASPDKASQNVTKGDVIFIYKLIHDDHKSHWPWNDKKIIDKLLRSKSNLISAVEIIGDALKI